MDAQYFYGLLCYYGQGIPQNAELAIEYFQLAAEQGHEDATSNLGMILTYGDNGATRDDAAARKWLESGVANGHAASMWMLGVMYRDGRGVNRNHLRARSLFSKRRRI